MEHRESLRVEPGKQLSLKSVDPVLQGASRIGDSAKEEIEDNRKKLGELQALLWAGKKYSLLIVLQAWTPVARMARQPCARRHQSTGRGVTGFKVPTARKHHMTSFGAFTRTLRKRLYFGFQSFSLRGCARAARSRPISEAVWEARYATFVSLNSCLRTTIRIYSNSFCTSAGGTARTIRRTASGSKPQLENIRIGLHRTSSLGRLYVGL